MNTPEEKRPFLMRELQVRLEHQGEVTAEFIRKLHEAMMTENPALSLRALEEKREKIPAPEFLQIVPKSNRNIDLKIAECLDAKAVTSANQANRSWHQFFRSYQEHASLRYYAEPVFEKQEFKAGNVRFLSDGRVIGCAMDRKSFFVRDEQVTQSVNVDAEIGDVGFAEYNRNLILVFSHQIAWKWDLRTNQLEKLATGPQFDVRYIPYRCRVSKLIAKNKFFIDGRCYEWDMPFQQYGQIAEPHVCPIPYNENMLWLNDYRIREWNLNKKVEERVLGFPRGHPLLEIYVVNEQVYALSLYDEAYALFHFRNGSFEQIWGIPRKDYRDFKDVLVALTAEVDGRVIAAFMVKDDLSHHAEIHIVDLQQQKVVQQFSVESISPDMAEFCWLNPRTLVLMDNRNKYTWEFPALIKEYQPVRNAGPGS